MVTSVSSFITSFEGIKEKASPSKMEKIFKNSQQTPSLQTPTPLSDRVVAEWVYSPEITIELIQGAETFVLVKEKGKDPYRLNSSQLKNGRDLECLSPEELLEKVSLLGASNLKFVLRNGGQQEKEVWFFPKLEGAMNGSSSTTPLWKNSTSQKTVNRITLILAGGVSVGTYQAGALDELLYALDEINSKISANEDKIIIDVITGASAGSLNAALVARKMFCPVNNGEMGDSIFYKAWVEGADIGTQRDAIKMEKSQNPCALFSNALQKKLAGDYIVSAGSNGSQASYAPDRLSLEFSLTRLESDPKKFPENSEGPDSEVFTADFFASSFKVLSLSREVFAEHSEIRGKIAEAAIASGAFPLGLEPMRITKKVGDQAERTAGFEYKAGYYIDGGMLNNEPIKQAIELSKLKEEEARKSLTPDQQKNLAFFERRKFILIDPNLNKGVSNDGWKEGVLRCHLAGVSMKILVQRIFEIIGAASQSQGWIKELEEMNEQSLRIRNLIDKINESALDAAAKTELEGMVNACLKKVDGYSGVDLSVIAAQPSQTAGDLLFAFGGFFKREWREYDYSLGMQDMRNFFRDNVSNCGFDQWRNVNPIAGDGSVSANLSGVSFQDLFNDASVKEKFDRFDGILHDKLKRMLLDLDLHMPVDTSFNVTLPFVGSFTVPGVRSSVGIPQWDALYNSFASILKNILYGLLESKEISVASPNVASSVANGLRNLDRGNVN